MVEKIIRFQKVASTQDTAKRFVHRREEVAIAALSQSRGRGRQGRFWYSPKGGLYLSLVLFPKKRHTSIPLLASLSIIKTLEDLNFTKLSIHWPNDVLLNNKKVCGVICEAYKDAVICGIGLNVNIEKFDHLENVTSLRFETGKDYEIDRIIEWMIGRFNPLYLELQDRGLKIRDILNYISGIGESVEVATSKGVIQGVVYDIDDDWGLLLRDENGVITKFYYGDVRRLAW